MQGSGQNVQKIINAFMNLYAFIKFLIYIFQNKAIIYTEEANCHVSQNSGLNNLVIISAQRQINC